LFVGDVGRNLSLSAELVRSTPAMSPFDFGNVKFRKSGAEIKQAVTARLQDLGQRLARRDADLDVLMQDKKRLRSYLVRAEGNWYERHVRQLAADVPTEDHQEISELCGRIHRIESEIRSLKMVLAHLRDDQQFDLTYQEMIGYGFGGDST
jgi:hypothetical protein